MAYFRTNLNVQFRITASFHCNIGSQILVLMPRGLHIAHPYEEFCLLRYNAV
jgi:hypothetical protein